MIIIQLNGGLGNQMFQFSLGVYLKKKFKYTVKYDTSLLLNDPKRKIAIDNFAISINICSKKELNKIRGNIYLYRLFKKLNIIRNNILIESQLKNLDTYIVKDNSYIVGYWHTSKIVDPIREELISLFKIRDLCDNKYWKLINNSNCSVSIHVRRGDYVNERLLAEMYGVCSLDYYQKSINIFTNLEPVFFVFSDDQNWCKSNLDLNNVIFVENQNMNTDLLLMSCCEHNIISNSSFSWWGAWLNTNTNKKVIYPKPWHNRNKFDSEQICNKSWEPIKK